MADKVLYIGNILENSGYSVAGREILTAMDTVGIDVVARNIAMTGSVHKPNQLIKNLLEKDTNDCNIVIQHTLPEFFDYNGNFRRNIGMFAIETNSIPRLWVKYCKLMDELIVFNKHSKQVLRQHSIDIPIHVVPHPVNINKFTKSFQGQGLVGKIKAERDCFVFYTIGEFVSRKNYETLLKTYFSEFSPSDNACLVIKTSRSDMSNEQCHAEFEALINHVKQNMKLHKYPEVVVVCDYLTEQQIEQLHYESDAYISLSHGEAWNLSCVDAIGFGKTPIAGWHTGHKDYMEQACTYPIKQIYEENCYNTGITSNGLYSGKDTWYGVNIDEVRKVMRNVYSNYIGLYRRKTRLGLDSIQWLSYDKVGSLIKDIINGTPQKTSKSI